MTRAEQIEQAAKRYVKDIVTPLPASLVVAFVKGAEYADQHPSHAWIDKAYEWIEKFAYNSVVTDNLGEREKQAIIVSFKECMEEQQ